MRSLFTLSLSLLTLLASTAHAKPLDGAAGLFYGYSSFCAQPKQPTPPPGTAHMCIDSSDGPYLGTMDANRQVQVFINPANKNQFVIVLFDTEYGTARVRTADRRITIYPADMPGFPNCVRYEVADNDEKIVDVESWCAVEGNYQLKE